MKVKVLSDLHLEFFKDGDLLLDPGEGDVLILAGDICDAAAFIFRCDADLRGAYNRFFESCARGYDKVFYVMGNHEHYNGVFGETADILREHLPEGITLLDNNSALYNGVHFVGATMWSNFKRKDPDSMTAAISNLNDYRYIFKNSKLDTIDPEFILNENENTETWLRQCFPTLRGPIFMISHHCPSFKSIDPEYVDSDTVGCYASDMEDLIKSTPNLLYWVHGHVHSSKSYMIGDCNVICNPRGYREPEYQNKNFNANLVLEL